MNKLKNTIVTLSKLYPNDEVFGSEIRKIVWDIRKEKHKKEKKSWDRLTKTSELAPWKKLIQTKKEQNENS